MSNSRWQENENISSTAWSNLLISGVAGSLIGATTALLLAPKSGEKLRRDISNVYSDLTDKTQEMAEDIRDRTSKYISPPEKNSYLLTGAISGALLGATLAFLLTQEKEDNSYLCDIKDKIKESAQSMASNITSMDWLDTAKDVVNEINDKIHHHNGSNATKHAEHYTDNVINKALDFAIVGLEVWQKMKKKEVTMLPKNLLGVVLGAAIGTVVGTEIGKILKTQRKINFQQLMHPPIWVDKAKKIGSSIIDEMQALPAFRQQKTKTRFTHGAIFGFLGGASLIWLLTKQGATFRRSLQNRYHDLALKSHEFMDYINDGFKTRSKKFSIARKPVVPKKKLKTK